MSPQLHKRTSLYRSPSSSSMSIFVWARRGYDSFIRRPIVVQDIWLAAWVCSCVFVAIGLSCHWIFLTVLSIAGAWRIVRHYFVMYTPTLCVNWSVWHTRQYKWNSNQIWLTGTNFSFLLSLSFIPSHLISSHFPPPVFPKSFSWPAHWSARWAVQEQWRVVNLQRWVVPPAPQTHI